MWILNVSEFLFYSRTRAASSSDRRSFPDTDRADVGPTSAGFSGEVVCPKLVIGLSREEGSKARGRPAPLHHRQLPAESSRAGYHDFLSLCVLCVTFCGRFASFLSLCVFYDVFLHDVLLFCSTLVVLSINSAIRPRQAISAVIFGF